MPSTTSLALTEAPQPMQLGTVLAWRKPAAPLRFCAQCGGPLTYASIDRHERQVCAAQCGFIVWEHPVPVVAVIVELHEQAVVLVCNRGWPTECFGLVSGYLEPGETAEQGALREVKEELGLDAELGSFVGSYPFAEFNQLVLVYHVTAQGSIQIDENEIAEIRLVPPAQLRPWNFAAGLGLRDWLTSRGEQI